jgi:ABC-type antimicrobial peptide transport system permease subunit
VTWLNLALADLGRRRLQTAAVLATTFLAAGTATLGLALLAPGSGRVFGVLTLAASAAVVANLVAGVALAGCREAGVLKAAGFTPGQVVAAMCLELLVPAAAGGVPGAVVGTLLSQPLFGRSAHALGVPALAATLGVAALAAALPALRAGRMTPARAIAAGAASPAPAGPWLGRALSRVPRPVALGVTGAFARPLRALLGMVAVTAGVAAVPFAFGSGAALAAILVLVVAAGAGSTVLLTARDRARDTAVLRALGMTPADVAAMVLCSAAALAITGGAFGTLTGIALVAGQR